MRSCSFILTTNMSHPFLPHIIRNFLFGTNTQQPDVQRTQPPALSLSPSHSLTAHDWETRSDSSMPDLQSLSDSDSEQDERDVEMHVVEDDWTDDEDNIPPLEPVPPPAPEPQRVHPWNFGLGTAPGQTQPDFRHIFPLFPPPRPRTQPQPAPPPHAHAHTFVLALDANGRRVPMPQPADGAPPTLPFIDLFIGTRADAPGIFPGPAAGDMPTWPEVMQMFGRETEEQEDPERAAKLVAGLEQVPVGLVKRMIRVGGAPGAHTDQAQSPESDTPGCAICWDTLLDQLELSDTPKEDAKIISLPCSHVFHASCLIPWFSKPRHTTCPTCRFNVDPENLTYNPRRREPRQAPTDLAGETQADEAQPANAGTLPADPTPPATEAHPAPTAERNLPPVFSLRDFFQPPAFPPTQQTVPPAQQNPLQGPPAFPPTQQTTPPATGPQPRNTQAHGPGFTVDFTWQVPVTTADNATEEQRLAEDMQTQAAAFVQQFLGNIAGGIALGAGGFAPGPGAPPMAFAFGPGGPEFGGPRFFTPGDSTSGGAPTTRVRKEWSPPPAPGPTLRQRVEQKEREAGLRCDDASCGVGPSDEDPCPSVSGHDDKIQIDSQGGGCVCAHRFHPACLVSADRCSGWGQSGKGEAVEEEYEVVACPMCRAVGRVERRVWEEGVEALKV